MKLLAFALIAVTAFAQTAPPFALSESQKGQIETRIKDIQSVDPDIQVFRKAGEWMLRHPEAE